ncbi:MAG: transglutaminase family protein [Opitutaceae bacterium]|nr:transglutaminase family protein [Cytophagales bacterium]
MKFKVTSELEYNVRYPSTFIFNIHALRTKNQTVLEETLSLDPFFRTEELNSAVSENRFLRLDVDKPTNLRIVYTATVDSYFQILDMNELNALPVVQLEGHILPYLFPSRYCQSDKLFRLAQDKFGRIENVYGKVLAINEWIYNNVEYLSGSTNSQTSAFDTVTERAGVCRDFAHLGITLCRALSIPARYFTGYSYQLNPQDFHACFEAYIGGQWIIFDATKLSPLNGLVKIATARDAADASVASIFGNVISTYVKVSCELLEQNFVPLFYNPGEMKGISY